MKISLYWCQKYWDLITQNYHASTCILLSIYTLSTCAGRRAANLQQFHTINIGAKHYHNHRNLKIQQIHHVFVSSLNQVPTTLVSQLQRSTSVTQSRSSLQSFMLIYIISAHSTVFSPASMDVHNNTFFFPPARERIISATASSQSSLATRGRPV